jgi:hypothetical protein
MSQSKKLANLANKAYVSWGSALTIAGVAAGGVAYDQRSQLGIMKENMATKVEVADVNAQLGVMKENMATKVEVADVKAQLLVQAKDIEILKGGMNEILKQLDAMSKKLDVMGK